MNRPLLTIAAALAAASLAAGCSTFSDTDVVASVGDTDLTEDELLELATAQGLPEENQDDLASLRTVMSGWIEGTAIENGLFSNETIEAVTDEQLAELYDQGLDASGVVCVRLVVTESVDAADDAIEAIDGGSDVDDVVAEFNQDPTLAADGSATRCFDSQQIAGNDGPEVDVLRSVNADNATVSTPSVRPDGSEAGFVAVFQTFDELDDGLRPQIGPNLAIGVAVNDLDISVDPRYGTFDPRVRIRGCALTIVPTPTITVVGLGPGGADHITTETLEAIATIERRHIRTTVHPTAHLVTDAPGGATAHDDLYASADTFDDVYEQIAERLLDDARAHGHVLYAVPGSPLVLERTVRHLRSQQSVQIDVRPAMSFLDVAWARLGIDPVDAGVRLVDGHDFATSSAGDAGPLLVAHTHANWVLSDIKLTAEDASGDEPVVLLHALGTPDEQIVDTTWAEMDRAIEADHLTSLFVPALAAPVGRHYVRFHQLARTLREQCPWDIEQTHESLIPFLLEETYEVVDALQAVAAADDDSADDDLIEELGDLLYQIEFHATIAEQEGRFSMADVAEGIHDKLVRRHPHVFGDAAVDGDVDTVLGNWDEIKRAEKGRTSVFDGIPRSMPALSYAAKVGTKASKVGFDWPDVSGAFEKIPEETAELREVVARGQEPQTTEELGDLLFAVVNVARHVGVDPELALRTASDKFRARFEGVERLARERHIDLRTSDLVTLDRLWDQVKAERAD